MDNAFITQWFDWDREEPRRVRLLNRLFRLFGQSARVILPHRTGEMSTVEQRINMYHLLSQVLIFEVPGDVVEIGVHQGHSAALFQRVIADHAPRQLHLFDVFREPPADAVREHFQSLGLADPIVHAGWLDQTLPAAGIPQICFAHIDLGPGRSPEHHEQSLLKALEFVYPRLSPRGVCLVADYCDPGLYQRPGWHFPRSINFANWWHLYPQVKHACDRFLIDKPERMVTMYGGEYSHGFFHKQNTA